MDFSNIPVLWQRNTPEETAILISDDPLVRLAISQVIKDERAAARPYVQSCTDARWADTPSIQESIHAVLLNGVDVTAVCTGFNTTEGWCELLVTAGSYPDGRPKMILSQDHRNPTPLTVRVCGDIQVIMTGALNWATPRVEYQTA